MEGKTVFFLKFYFYNSFGNVLLLIIGFKLEMGIFFVNKRLFMNDACVVFKKRTMDERIGLFRNGKIYLFLKNERKNEHY